MLSVSIAFLNLLLLLLPPILFSPHSISQKLSMVPYFLPYQVQIPLLGYFRPSQSVPLTTFFNLISQYASTGTFLWSYEYDISVP